MKNGTLAALAAYILWGILPIYWKTIEQVPAAEILAHRVVWSVVVVAVLLSAQKRWGWLKKVARKPAILVPFVGSTLLLTANWFIYLWANNNGHIVEVSLGYFINPLVNVLLGVLLLRERMRPWQWASIGLAFAGVAYLTISYGRLPWIAVSLALTFAFYGLIRKMASLGSIEGLTVETSLMFLPALVFLIFLGAQRNRRVRPGRRADDHAIGLCRPGHRDSADVVRSWGPQRAAVDAGRAPIRRADPAIPGRRGNLPRGVFRGADGWIQHDLGCAPAVLAGGRCDAPETGAGAFSRIRGKALRRR